ncbi:209_t:CDS:2, partial [Cetraspora pellucida]
YEDEISMLAYVQWVRNLENYGNNILYFQNFGEFGIINVITIDRCVGFLKLETNKYIIIDRKNLQNTIGMDSTRPEQNRNIS